MASAAVVLPFSVNGEEQYTMIELQGVLECTAGALNAQELGTFQVAGELATLCIGTHELKGRQVKLAKALVVTSTSGDGVTVLGVVRTKYVFKTRPNTVGR